MDDDRSNQFSTLQAELDKSYQGERYFLNENISKIYLKQREADVMALLLRGLNRKFVARAMNVSIHTVDFYIKNIQLKLNVFSIKEMSSLVRETNFLSNYYAKN